jgi:hypothetical protein
VVRRGIIPETVRLGGSGDPPLRAPDDCVLSAGTFGRNHRRESLRKRIEETSSVVFLSATLLIFAADLFAMPKPPLDAMCARQGNTLYYTGSVYVNSPDDTVKLKSLGFRDFEFDGRSFGSVRYKAKWPQSVAEVPAPDYVNGLNYDLSRPDRVFPEFAESYSGGGYSSYYPMFGRQQTYFSDDAPTARSSMIGCRTRRS